MRRDIARRAFCVLVWLVAIASVVYILESSRAPTRCEKCGASMRPMEDHPNILQCTRCDFAIDTSFQR